MIGSSLHQDDLDQNTLLNDSGIVGSENIANDVAENIDSQRGDTTEQKSELLTELQESNKAMKIEIDKLTKIAGTSQAQYISLKSEFDAYIKRIDFEKKEIKLIELKKIVSKFSKLLEQLRLFLSHLDETLGSHEQIKGFQLIYESFINQELSQMGVFQIQSLGLLPDPELHEVLMLQPVDDNILRGLLDRGIKLDGEKETYTIQELSGHCIQELEVGYYYFDGEKKIVIKPSKVVVGE
ncbi:MAG TPA: nucleotide exchange factor GrpE [Candidatus Absconditabacterales bacterium]|nr:nucleotide exchange factor GrpE [Candidatus Absconditabacterales bacterium]HNG96647.1 nucleotide exchange factor GrpE [Candidatus Absconditabacterales bacterium]